MPYLRFKGFTTSFLEKLTPSVVKEFSRIVNIPEETVKIESLHVEPITNSPQSLEIFMFPRKQEIHDAVASCMNGLLLERGFRGVHIFFVLLSPSLYYKEGKPLTGYSLTP